MLGMDDEEPQGPASGFVPVDPFAYKVAAGNDDMTLFTIADHIAELPLSDLRALNPALDELPADKPVPAGTVVRLVPKVVQRAAAPLGSYFVLGAEERETTQCYERLDALVEDVAAKAGAEVGKARDDYFALPPRSVLSKTEQLMTVVRSEAERQLPNIEAEMSKPGMKAHHFKYLVDSSAVQRKIEDVEKHFSEDHIRLDCFRRANVLPFDTLDAPSSLTPATIQPHVCDDESDFCMHHSHRWEFTFQSQSSVQDAETWAVLSCQKLTVLFDVFECLPSQFTTDGRLQNAFMFIGGVFYVDDRHAGEPGYEDLSASIRSMDPLTVLASSQATVGYSSGEAPQPEPPTQGTNLGFGQCPVRGASTVTFGDLRVRFGEQGVIRHRGCCDHYFSLSAMRSLRGYTRTARSSYPHRVMKRREVVLRCALCEQYPSTVVLYGDERSTTNPAAYCVMCFELLHQDETEEEASRYVKVVAKPGEYFKRPY